MIFWESTHIARKEYVCDHCTYSICRGDEYHRSLWKVSSGRVYVMRQHAECPPDDDFDKAPGKSYAPQSLPLAA